MQRRLGIIYADNEALVRSRASGYTLAIIGTVLLLAVTALLVSDSWATRLQVIIISMYVGAFLTDYFINKSSLKMLYEEDKLILNQRHEYHKTYMVNESMERVAEDSDDIIATHAQRIADILNSTDPESELQSYYEVAPNKYMKDFAGISYKVAEYGDSGIENGESSVYLASLGNIREDLHIEINRREILNRKLSGLVAVAVSPIFMTDPIRRWSETNFPIMSEYYNSNWGLYSLVLLYIIFVVAFVVLRNAKSVDGDPQGAKEEGKWLKKILKTTWIRKIVYRLAPKTHELKRFQVEQELKHANSRLDVPSLYLWKASIFAIALISAIIIQLLIVAQIKHNIVYPNESIYVTASQTTSQQQMSKERYVFESTMIGEIISKDLEPQEIVPYVLEMSQNKPFLQLDIDRNEYAQQIVDRVEKYNNQYFRWYQLLIALGIAILGYSIPNAYLSIKQQSRRWQMQDEVDGFTTSIMMLSQFQRISVYEILEWMQRDSYIFQEQLMNCLLDYESGSAEALEELKETVNFVPLERLVERLQEAADQLPIQEAFDDIRIERNYAVKQRQEYYEKSTSRKVATAQLAAYTPLGSTIIIYLFVPFIYVMYQQLGDLTQITGGL